jgi:predicted TIM-barrel fold metal-dependent hydrolase
MNCEFTSGVEPKVPSCAQADPNPRTPRFNVPNDAVDCHAHIFGPTGQYPYAKGRAYTPPDASLSDYLHVLDTIGVRRGVLVQPSVYGFDNSCLVDALAKAGRDFRGVVVVDPRCGDDELDRLHALGVRGVRFNVLFGGGAALDQAWELGRRIRRLGWHIQLLLNASAFDGLCAFVRDSPVPVVIDHMGHVPAHLGVENKGFQALLAVLRERNCWVKLSASYRLTNMNHPPYSDVAPLAKALVDASPDRCVWGTDWPHPQIAVPMPNDGNLMDHLLDWIPDEEIRRCVLVDNPARLYDF